jgi:hypothetical protein
MYFTPNGNSSGVLGNLNTVGSGGSVTSTPVGPSSAPTTTPTTTQTGGGAGATSSGSGTSSANPYYSQQTSTINGQISNLNGLYNQLFGQLGSGLQTSRQGIDQNYADQQTNLGNQFSQTTPQLARMEAARGLTDSSYNADQQNNALQTYQGQGQAITDQRTRDENTLAGNYANQLGQYQGQLQGINNQAAQLKTISNDANSNYRLGSIEDQLNQSLGPIQGALGAAQTPAGLQSLLGNVAPSQVYNSGALQSLISSLGQSTAPVYAQGAIGQTAQNNIPGLAALQQKLT